ncbi:MAG: radical SAM protein [Fibrobacterales bacterium]
MGNKEFLHTRQTVENARCTFEKQVELPSKLVIELSNSCNHSCGFCANKYMTRTKKIIDLGLAYKIIEDAADMGIKELSLVATGEPFIYKNIDKVIAHAKACNFEYIYITTNGALATPDRIKGVIDAGLDSLKFSFNASDREWYQKVHGKDDFEKVISHIQYAIQYREEVGAQLNLGISCVVTKGTVEGERDKIMKLFDAKLDDVLCQIPGSQGGYMVDENELLIESDPDSIKKFSCRLPFTTIHVTSEGYYNLCCIDFQNYLAVVDLKESSLMETWNSPKMQEIREKMLTKNYKDMLCYKCLNRKNGPIVPVNKDLATEFDFVKNKLTPN